ncbi:hypothetical protein [Aliamphritea spongicola]|nr:hypothetical protein [Aliamphritea spongicola]
MPVTTLQVAEYEVRPTVTGYGEVEPDILLDVRAEVAGKVVYVHPQLKQGVLLPAGTLVVQIDDSDYVLALKKPRPLWPRTGRIWRSRRSPVRMRNWI